LEPESIAQSATICISPLPSEFYWELFILLILILISALLSGSEVSFFKLTSSEKSFINNSEKKVYHLIRDLLSVPDKVLATIIVAGIFFNLSIILLSTSLVNKIINLTSSSITVFIIEVIIISIIILLFCEILPKVIASNHKLNFAKRTAILIKICSILFTPLTYILIHSTSFINKRISKYRKNLSIEDISHALENTPDTKLPEEKGMFEGIVSFGSTSAYQIMSPRIDIVAIEIDTPFDKIVEIINNSGYSRMPVYNETFDKIEGILYSKDLLPHLNDRETFNWKSILRQPYYIPENKKIDDLLKEFQKNKVHMAIVVDEYGGTSGIVTLEDILEEIVGDITDEFDNEDRLYSKINETTFIFDGKTQLNDFNRIFNLQDDFFDEVKYEADSLAGLLLELKSDFPKLNEKLSYRYFDFIVESIDNSRIKKIKVLLNKNSHLTV
jgi:putative hemolysin